MRIAYLALGLNKFHFKGGVGHKIDAQRGWWRDFGHEEHLFFLTPDEVNHAKSTAFQYGPLSGLPLLKNITRFISRSMTMARLIEQVRNYHPDLIYLRYGLYAFPLHKIFKLAPVIVELNSDDLVEYRHYGWLSYWLNLFTRGISFRNSSGLVLLSHELAKIPDNASLGKPIRVIANGIDFEKNQLLASPKNITPIITIVASAGAVWHGVDKLIYLAKRFPDLTINIVGDGQENMDGLVPSNVHMLGFVPRDQVRDILMLSDVACGTLALHRKNMQEASPLKVREAVAYGIPLILGYHDTDLSEIKNEYVLNIPNTEDNVKTYAEQIRSFAYKMMGRRLDREAFRACLDQIHKEEVRLQFFADILQKKANQIRYKIT